MTFESSYCFHCDLAVREIAGNMRDDFPRELFRIARVGLGLTSEEFAQLAQISPSTVLIAETLDRDVSTRTLRKIRQTLEDQGIVFLRGEPGKGPGIRLPDNFASTDGTPSNDH